MDANSTLSPEELAFFRALLRREVRFMIVGISAAALQGAPLGTLDIDLWFEDLSDPGIAAALKEVGGAWVPAVGLSPPALAGRGIERLDVVLSVSGLDSFAREWRRTVRADVGGVRVPILRLDRIIVNKRAADRPKDRAVLPALEAAWTVIRESKTSAVRRPARCARRRRPKS